MPVASYVDGRNGHAGIQREERADTPALRHVAWGYAANAIASWIVLDTAEDKIIYEFTHKQHEAAQKVFKLPEAQQKARWDAMAKENEEFIKKNLSAEQCKRLDQIAMQTAGLLMITKPSLAGQIKLNAEQKRQIAQLQEQSRDIFHALISATSKEGRNEKLAELRKSNDEQLVKVLTEEQRTTWKALAGAPFKGKLVFEEVENGK